MRPGNYRLTLLEAEPAEDELLRNLAPAIVGLAAAAIGLVYAKGIKRRSARRRAPSRPEAAE